MSHSYSLLTLDEQANILGDNLPYSKLFEGKDIEGSNIRALLKGMSPEFMSLRFEVLKLTKELFLATSEDQISKWEAEYGIPDDVFLGNGSIEERKANIVTKLFIQNLVRKRKGDLSIEDFKNIAQLIGVDVDIYTGKQRAILPALFPVPLMDEKTSKFVIILDFKESSSEGKLPALFPVLLTENFEETMIRLFEKIKPSNVTLHTIYNVTEQDSEFTILTTPDGKLLTFPNGALIDIK